MSTLHGAILPATTPFDAHGDIQFDAAGRQIKWLIENGAQGVAVGGSTGEGQTLDREEFRDLIAASTDAAAGQVPVIAGIITDSTREAVIRGKMIRDLKTAALQVTPVHYLFKPSDDAMVEHFRTLAGETGQKIIIYNVVPWTYLSPALLLRIMDEVPDVIGVKQRAGGSGTVRRSDGRRQARQFDFQRRRRVDVSVLHVGRPWLDRRHFERRAPRVGRSVGRRQGRRSRPRPRPAPKTIGPLERVDAP